MDYQNFQEQYKNRFPRYAHYIIFLESRIIPFLLIYLIAAIHTFIDYLNSSIWPYNAFIGILDGRYTNIVFYSLFLFLVLRYKLKPSIAIPLFLGGSVAFYILDKVLNTHISAGIGIIIIKFTKISFLVAILLYEYFKPRLTKLVATSLLTGIFIVLVTIATYSILYNATEKSNIKKEVTFKLLRYGIPYNVNECKTHVVATRNYRDYQLLTNYASQLHLPVAFTNEEWEQLLFSESIQMADDVAATLLKQNITIPFDAIIEYAYSMSSKQSDTLQTAGHLARLAARYADGNENKIIAKFKEGNTAFKIWLMNVMGFHKKIIYLPVLLPLCADQNTKIATTAYTTLTQITGKNPSAELNRPFNDPYVLKAFKDFYFQSGKTAL